MGSLNFSAQSQNHSSKYCAYYISTHFFLFQSFFFAHNSFIESLSSSMLMPFQSKIRSIGNTLSVVYYIHWCALMDTTSKTRFFFSLSIMPVVEQQIFCSVIAGANIYVQWKIIFISTFNCLFVLVLFAIILVLSFLYRSFIICFNVFMCSPHYFSLVEFLSNFFYYILCASVCMILYHKNMYFVLYIYTNVNEQVFRYGFFSFSLYAFFRSPFLIGL